MAVNLGIDKFQSEQIPKKLETTLSSLKRMLLVPWTVRVSNNDRQLKAAWSQG